MVRYSRILSIFSLVLMASAPFLSGMENDAQQFQTFLADALIQKLQKLQIDPDLFFAQPSPENPRGGEGYRLLQPVGNIVGTGFGNAMSMAVATNMQQGVDHIKRTTHQAVHQARQQIQSQQLNAFLNEFFASPSDRNQFGGQGYQMLRPLCTIVAKEFGSALAGEAGQKIVQAICEELYRQVREGGSLGQAITVVADRIGFITRRHAFSITGGAVTMGVFGYAFMQGIQLIKERLSKSFNAPRLVLQELEPLQIKKTITDLRYPSQCENAIIECIRETHTAATSNGALSFRNVLLWGEPGTGKTELAHILAKETGMLVLITTGGDFGKLHGKDLEQIDNLFAYIRSKKRPVLLFIDELEHLFASRQSSTGQQGEQSNVLTKLLGMIKAMDNQLMIVGATNLPEKIDEAVLRRFPIKMHIGLPDVRARADIIALYVKKYFSEDMTYANVDRAQVEQFFRKAVPFIASETESFSGADLEALIHTIKIKARTYTQGMPTEAILFQTLVDFKKMKHAQRNGFVRASNL